MKGLVWSMEGIPPPLTLPVPQLSPKEQTVSDSGSRSQQEEKVILGANANSNILMNKWVLN